MKKLSVIIMHKLPNRVRLKLSEPIKSFETFRENVTKDSESIELKYSPATKSVVATFNPEKVNLQEAIYKILTAFSIENGMMPVKLLEGVEQKAIESFAIYSGASIMMSGINMLINRNDNQLQNIMNWFSISMTTAAILEHACIETNRKGVFDLEILPAVYLIKSFLNTPKLSIVAMIWLTTFGRHLISTNNDAKEVKFFRIKNKQENQDYYIANVSEDNSIDNIGDLIYHVFFRKNKNMSRNTEKYVTINK